MHLGILHFMVMHLPSPQMDPVMFSLASIATVANAYTNPEVFDKALLGRLANIIQQMDSKVHLPIALCHEPAISAGLTALA